MPFFFFNCHTQSVFYFTAVNPYLCSSSATLWPHCRLFLELRRKNELFSKTFAFPVLLPTLQIQQLFLAWSAFHSAVWKIRNPKMKLLFQQAMPLNCQYMLVYEQYMCAIYIYKKIKSLTWIKSYTWCWEYIYTIMYNIYMHGIIEIEVEKTMWVTVLQN